MSETIIALFSVSLIFGVFGNSLIIFIHGFASRERYLNFQRLLLFLAVSDLLKTISMSPFYIYLEIHQGENEWMYGMSGCKMIPSLWCVFNYVSLGVLSVMVIEKTCTRMWTGSHLSWKQVTRGVGVVSVLAIVRCVPRIYDLSLVNGECQQRLTGGYRWSTIILSILMEGAFAILCFVAVIYLKCQGWSKRKPKRSRKSGGSFVHGDDLANYNQTNRNIVFVYCLIFIISTLPYSCYIFYQSFVTSSEDHQNEAIGYNIQSNALITRITILLSSFSGCLNVLIALFMKSFREEVVTHVTPIRWLCSLCNGGPPLSNTIIIRSIEHIDCPSGPPVDRLAPQRSQRRAAFDDEHHFSLLYQ
eukprot:TCONS_00005694-protein